MVYDGKPWLKSYDPDVPENIEIPAISLKRYYVETFEQHQDTLYKHPAIGMCALIGILNPDRPDSEIVKLFVQKSEAYTDKPDEAVKEEIIAFSKEKLAPYKVPKIVEFMDAIPLTSVGKVNKKSLRV